MIARRVAAAVVAAASVLVVLAVPVRAVSPAYVTLLFSRTEVGAADACAPDSDGIEPLMSIAADMQSLGLAGTGTLVTTPASKGEYCTHNGDTIAGSFADAQQLAQLYNWRFVSHTADYPGPAKIARLTPAQSWAETCGSAQALETAGLPGATGMIAYPGAQGFPAALQSGYGQNCFDWAREYGAGGITKQAAASAVPYVQRTAAVHGGPCNDPAANCYSYPAAGSKRYDEPAAIIARVEALKPGQWLTLQGYVFVTGTSPAYTVNSQRWDCSSPDPAEHWTNDVERYCYSDYLLILQAIAADPNVTVTDPATVAAAWGRSATGMPPP